MRHRWLSQLVAAKEGKFIDIRREKPPQMNEHSELRSGPLWLFGFARPEALVVEEVATSDF